MMHRAMTLLDELERKGVGALGLALLREELQASQHKSDALERYPAMLQRVLALCDSGPTVGEVLDELLDLVGATRGFVGFFQSDDTWRIATARGPRGVLDGHTRQLTSSLIQRARARNGAVIVRDAMRQLPRHALSIAALRVGSIAVLPLGHPARGFVYLDNPGSDVLFDNVALSVVQAFLPLIDRMLVLCERKRACTPIDAFLTRSTDLQAKLAEVARASAFDLPVLLFGETGTGKSHLAELLHRASPRAEQPFVHVNCSAIPEALLEQQLYGSEGGSQGVHASRMGLFEAARGGTLFLDGLDSLPLYAQAKLLQAVQQREITRIGGAAPLSVDIRVVAAISVEPGVAVEDGLLREDLYYRLSVVEVGIPPLRERVGDIPLLARAALTRSHMDLRLPLGYLVPDALDKLITHDWPGNVRELNSVLDRAAVLSPTGAISPRHLVLDGGLRAVGLKGV